MILLPRSPSAGAPTLVGTSLQMKPAPNLQLADQFGRRITLSQFRGHPVVLTFLESHCKSTCPVVAEKLRQALDDRGLRRVAVLAVSVDPEHDSMAAVVAFSREHGLLHRWHYLTGSRAQLVRVWRRYYVYAAPRGASRAATQGHTAATFLLDPRGRERILLTGNPSEVALHQDLRILSGLPVTLAGSMSPAPEVGHPAPSFALSSLTGKPVSLRALRGRVILLNFWATWCTACRTEMPRLVAWFTAYHRRGFTVVGIDLQEDPGTVRAFTRRYHVWYPILLDQAGDVSARYNVVGLPTSFLIDRHGAVQSVHIGIVESGYLRSTVLRVLQG